MCALSDLFWHILAKEWVFLKSIEVYKRRGFAESIQSKGGYLPKKERESLHAKPLAVRKNGGYTGVKHRLVASQMLG